MEPKIQKLGQDSSQHMKIYKLEDREFCFYAKIGP